MAFRRTSVLPIPDALLAALLVLGVSLFGIGCREKNAQAGKPAAVDVQVVPVEQKDVPIYGEWIGTLDGLVDADVRAQVTGYLLSQDYTEGLLRAKGPTPVRDRSPTISSRSRPVSGTARNGKRTACSGQGAVSAGPSPARAIGGKPTKSAN